MADWALQQGHGVRFDWGPAGAERLAPECACLVVVDVLSFTTAVEVAVEAGTRVFPYAWRDASAASFAAERDAELAVGRRASGPAAPWSLSPAALRRAPFAPRLVLPSPNGSAIAAAAAPGSVVVAASLRNAEAVGRWLAGAGFGTQDRPVAVIAAGERWPEGALRPALEDLLGAGAVISAVGAGACSPEASAAAGAYASTSDVAAAVHDCASGRELAAGGFAEDVAVAVELGVSEVVPVLGEGGGFGAAA
ncbi:2-phosphosulfolactate phosphatase [Streptomyces monticola]|uniref:Probable 2-phosphosulfolactate phosphatase n=1 Tax=Streptomyces monticola TaxID=2666263 RepID=A0ABW2JKK9_9ACTN